VKSSEIAKLWMAYAQRPADMTVHPYDNMYNTAQKPADYAFVGESGIEVISSVLAVAPTTHVGHVLDFSCGHGRVGRFIRALFPEARITFSEVDAEAANFCANQFRGTALVTPKDFNALTLPETYDVIWLGSVFTHMDYERMKVLFGKLFNALNPKGVLIGTFRGEKMYQSYKNFPELTVRDAELLRSYEETGVAYQRYPGWKDDWGLSLVKPAKLMELGKDHPTSRLMTYAEVGWANAHDVLAWTNVSPGTIIR
jgi:SAM-dependent methyltransferase